MLVYTNKGLPYIVMHLPFISIGWKVVDKPLGAGLKLFIVNISLKNVLHTCHYKENKNIQTCIIIRNQLALAKKH